ncbi:MAG TPA: hypothetical protein VGM93_10090, partial [Acidimicrobiales bacterium]
DELRLVAAGTTAQALGHVTISTLGGTDTYRVPASGVIRLPRQRTDRVTVEFPDHRSKPVGLSELEAPAFGTGSNPSRSVAVRLPCGAGPALRVDGRKVPTRVDTTAGALADLAPVRWTACGAVPFAPGAHHIVGSAADGGVLRIDTLRVAPVAGLPPVAAPRPVQVQRWSAEDRRLEVGPGAAAFLATTENANGGWRATLDGHPLTAVRIDGWRQGWLVPAGRGGTVVMTYGPGATQRLALEGGALLLLLLLAAAVVPAGRRRRRAEDDREATSAPPGSIAGVERRLGAPWIVLITAGAAFVLGGWLVALLIPAAWLVVERRRWVPWVAGVAVTGTLGLALVQPGAQPGSGRGTYSAAAQIFGVLAVVVLSVSALPDGLHRPSWFPGHGRERAGTASGDTPDAAADPA